MAEDVFSGDREALLDMLQDRLREVKPWNRRRALEIVEEFLSEKLFEEDRHGAVTPLYEEGAINATAFAVCPWPVDPHTDALVVDFDGAHRAPVADYLAQAEAEGLRFR